MKDKLLPDYCVSNVDKLDEDFYKSHNIKAAIFDIDNTLVAHTEMEPPQNVIDYFSFLKSVGIKYSIVSNNSKERVHLFCKELNIPYYYKALKPRSKYLKKALSDMGVSADKAVLVTDRVLGGADTWATSTTLAGAIRNLEYDLIITGRQAIDGDTAQVGPQIAEHLQIPVISYAEAIEVKESSVVVKRQYDDRYHMVEAKMPCLITALAELNDPRYMTPGGIFDACAAEITTWGRADLKDVDDANLGLKGSPTKIAKASDKVRKGAGEKVNPDSPEEAVSYIVGKLTEKHVI